MSFSRPLAPKRNSAAFIQSRPSSSFMSASHSVDCLAVRIPPAGLKPTAMPVSCAYSRMARVITNPTGSVALVVSLPVEVLMKSAPAIMATTLARPTLRRVSRSPVPRITFMCAGTQACLKAAISSYSSCQRPPNTCARVMTTSISSAPASTERRISSMRSDKGESPAGKPVDKAVVHADGRHSDVEVFDAQPPYQVLLDRMNALGAQAAHALLGVVAREGRQVHAGDCAQQPRDLPVFLHRAAQDVALRAPFHGAGVDPHLPHPVEIQRNAAIREQRPPAQCGDRSRGRSLQLLRGMAGGAVNDSVTPGVFHGHWMFPAAFLIPPALALACWSRCVRTQLYGRTKKREAHSARSARVFRGPAAQRACICLDTLNLRG